MHDEVCNLQSSLLSRFTMQQDNTENTVFFLIFLPNQFCSNRYTTSPIAIIFLCWQHAGVMVWNWICDQAVAGMTPGHTLSRNIVHTHLPYQCNLVQAKGP